MTAYFNIKNNINKRYTQLRINYTSVTSKLLL